MNKEYSIIGGGKVAQTLARELNKVGFSLQYFWNRSLDCGLDPSLYGGRRVQELSELVRESNWIIIAVSDDAVSSCSAKIADTSALVTHTSGLLGLDVLQLPRAGVFYPLQTFNGPNLPTLSGIPFFVDTAEKEDRVFLHAIVNSLGGTAMELSQKQKERLHLAAVFANNYTNQMLQIAAEICALNDISFEVLRPLMDRTISNAFTAGPENSQTGPAIRGDKHTLKKHLALLTDPELQEIYKLLAHRINPKNREL